MDELAIPNLDAMCENDLLEVARVLRLLTSYATIKADAMCFRSLGSIDIAQAREAQCERLYMKLPRNIQW